MHHLCEKCGKSMALLFLIVGLLFLLRDINVWNFWSISWWTAGFILVGLHTMAHHSCPMCKKLK